MGKYSLSEKTPASYLPYFSLEVLKRISDTFKLGYEACISDKPKDVYEIVQALIK